MAILTSLIQQLRLKVKSPPTMNLPPSVPACRMSQSVGCETLRHCQTGKFWKISTCNDSILFLQHRERYHIVYMCGLQWALNNSLIFVFPMTGNEIRQVRENFHGCAWCSAKTLTNQRPIGTNSLPPVSSCQRPSTMMSVMGPIRYSQLRTGSERWHNQSKFHPNTMSVKTCFLLWFPFYFLLFISYFAENWRSG